MTLKKRADDERFVAVDLFVRASKSNLKEYIPKLQVRSWMYPLVI